MPTYCYETKDGRREHRLFAISKAPSRITLQDGTVAMKNFICGCPRASMPTNDRFWREGITSTAAGVLPEQRQEAMEQAARMGVPTYFNSEGDPVFHSHSQRKRFLKAHGLIDKDGYD